MFLSISFLIFVLFILLLPILFLLGLFKIFSIGFQELGLSPGIVFGLLFLTLIGSQINIPLGRYKVRYVRKNSFFGFLGRREKEIEGLAINLGGAVIPLIISGYLLYKSKEILPIIFSLILVACICKILARVVPQKGIFLPAFIPPIFSALFAVILSPANPAFTAYIAGTLGTLIGADLLNLHKLRRFRGFISIGGAGVFDGIFLSGIAAVLLTLL